MLCYNNTIIVPGPDCEASRLTAVNSHTWSLERPDDSPGISGITYVQHVLRLCSLPFALLVAGVATASESHVDLPDVTVQAQAAEEGESDLHTPTTSGSRLELSALQTPASTSSLSGAEVRGRNNLTVQDAVTRTPGISSIGSPGNGGTALSARGFSGHASTMQLYDGTRQYIGAGTVTFPVDTWSVARIDVLRGPARCSMARAPPAR